MAEFVREGSGFVAGISQTLLGNDGTVSAPGLAFTLDPDTGLWRIGSDYGGLSNNWAIEGPRPWADVRAYGAVGDGITDDTTAIQNAINALPVTGGTVFLPEGSYKITSTLTIGNGSLTSPSTRQFIKLVGAGTGYTAAEISPLNACTKLLWAGSTGGTMITVSGPIAGVQIKDMLLDAATLAATGIAITHAFRSRFDNLMVARQTGFAYTITAYENPTNCAVGANENTWTNVRSISGSGTAYGGIQVGASAYTDSPHLDVAKNTWINCHWTHGATSYGIELRFTDACTFINCVTAGSGVGVQVSPPSGQTGFPGAVAFYNCALLGATAVTGTWAPTNRIMFWPYPVGDGEAVPTHVGFYGVTDTGQFFGTYGGFDKINAQIIPTSATGVIAASTTRYCPVGGGGVDATEANRQMAMPRAGTVRSLYVKTGSTQGAAGNFVITVRKNGVNTAVVVTISSGAVAGTFSDTSNSAVFAAGDLLSISAVNNDASNNSATISNAAFTFDSA